MRRRCRLKAQADIPLPPPIAVRAGVGSSDSMVAAPLRLRRMDPVPSHVSEPILALVWTPVPPVVAESVWKPHLKPVASDSGANRCSGDAAGGRARRRTQAHDRRSGRGSRCGLPWLVGSVAAADATLEWSRLSTARPNGEGGPRYQAETPRRNR